MPGRTGRDKRRWRTGESLAGRGSAQADHGSCGRGPRPVDGESLKEGETQESQGRTQPERSGGGGPNRQGEQAPEARPRRREPVSPAAQGPLNRRKRRPLHVQFRLHGHRRATAVRSSIGRPAFRRMGSDRAAGQADRRRGCPDREIRRSLPGQALKGETPRARPERDRGGRRGSKASGHVRSAGTQHDPGEACPGLVALVGKVALRGEETS